MRSVSPPHSSLAGEVKGIVLRNFAPVLVGLRGEGAWVKTRDALSVELREALERGSIVAGGWYPLAWYRDLHASARRATGSGDARLAWLIGRESTKRDLNSVYRGFLRVLSPRVVLSASTRFFGTYYRPGLMKLVESRDGFGRVTFTDCHGFDRDVWSDVFGGCEVTMELAGARSLRMRVELGGRDGDSNTTLIAWWASGDDATPTDPPTA